jgi:putative membrane protein
VIVLVVALIFGLTLGTIINYQEQLDSKKVVIVNNDESVKIADTATGATQSEIPDQAENDKGTASKDVIMGRQLAQKLVDGSASNYDFELTNSEDALEGLKEGKYLAALYIPKNFSKVITAYEKPKDLRQVKLDVVVSDNTKVLDEANIKQIVSTKVSEFGAEYSEQYLEKLFIGFNTLSTNLTMLDKGMEAMVKGLKPLNTGAAGLAKAGAPLSKGLTAMNKGVKGLTKAATPLNKAAKGLSAGAKGLNAGADGLVKAGKGLAQGQDAFNDGVQQLAQVASSLPPPALVAAVQGLAEGSSSLNAGIQGYISGVNQFSAGAVKFNNGVVQFNSGIVKFNNGVSKLGSGVVKMNEGVGKYVDGVTKFAGAIPQVTKGLGQFAKGLHELSSSTPSYTTAEIKNLKASAAAPISGISYITENPLTQNLWILVLILWIMSILISTLKLTWTNLTINHSAIILLINNLVPAKILSLISGLATTLFAYLFLSPTNSETVVILGFSIVGAICFSFINKALFQLLKPTIFLGVSLLIISTNFLSNMLGSTVDWLNNAIPLGTSNTILKQLLKLTTFDVGSYLNLVLWTIIAIITLFIIQARQTSKQIALFGVVE